MKLIIAAALSASLLISHATHATEASRSYSDMYLKDELVRLRLFELSNENAQVMRAYDSFLDSLRVAYLYTQKADLQDVKEIMGAIVFAASKHKNQTRKDQEQTPYIIHPIGVAELIVSQSAFFDKEGIIAALLHDTVEDTKTTEEEIKEKFGERVAEIVSEVTDDMNLSKKIRRKKQIESAPYKSDSAAAIKFADKLYNVRDFIYRAPVGYSEAKIKEYLLHAKRMTDELPQICPKLKEMLDHEIKQYFAKESL